MRTVEIRNTKNAEKNFFLDFTSDGFAVGLRPTAKGVVNAFEFCGNVYFPEGVNPFKIFYSGERVFVFASDGYLYRFYGDSVKKCVEHEFSYPPEVIAVTYFGKSANLISGDKSFVYDGNSHDVFGTTGEKRLFINGSLVYLKDGTVVFGGDFDYETQTDGITPVGVYKPHNEFGKAVGIESLGKNLVVVCENEIIVCEITGEFTDFKFNRINQPVYSAKEKTVKKVGDKVYFLGENGLNVYSGKVEKIKTLLNGVSFSVTGEAHSYSANYILPVSTGGKNCLFVFDTETEKSYFVPSDNICVSDGGYFANTVNGKIGSFTEGYEENSFFKIKDENLGKSGVKVLSELSNDGDGKVKVEITGDFGETEVVLKKKEKVRLGLASECFSFTVYPLSDFTLLKGLNLKYRG